MLRRVVSMAVAGCILAAFWGCQSASKTVPVKSRPELSVDRPVTKDNLTVWLVRGPDRSGGKSYLTLSEAMTQKKLVVHETGNVNELAVENVSDETVFIPAGSIVKGGQQDRTLGTDLIITKADGKMPIAAFCVESGRWAKRGEENAMFFSGNSHMVSGKAMKMASNVATTQPSQGAVWESVTMNQQALQQAAEMNLPSGQAENARADLAGAVVFDLQSRSSYQLSMETEAVKKLTEGRKAALIDAPKGRNDVVGYVYAVNNKIAGGNVYASPELFQKLWPMLLDAAVVESIAEAPTTQPSTPAVAPPPLPSQAEVAAALEDREKLTNTRKLNERTTVNAYDSAASTMTDTLEADGLILSRTLLVKPEGQPAQAQQQPEPQQQEPQLNLPNQPAR